MGIINAVTGMFKDKPEPKKECGPALIAPKASIEPLAEPKSYLELKEWLKARTLHIKARKKRIVETRKALAGVHERINQKLEAPMTWTDDRDPGSHEFFKRKMGQEYRIHHIAYSMLRGKTMEQIEPKTRNPLSEGELKEIESLKTACARPPRIEKQV